MLRLSGWAVFQHSMIGLLLLAAIVVGNTVEGGTLAYQVAWVFFLAPYAVLAQPIHTAILPDLTASGATIPRTSRVAAVGARRDGGARRAGRGRTGRARSADHARRRLR